MNASNAIPLSCWVLSARPAGPPRSWSPDVADHQEPAAIAAADVEPLPAELLLFLGAPAAPLLAAVLRAD
jgi:hypothetical protein